MYGKIFESMYDGTLSADWKAMITFQQMIVIADKEGIVDITPPALSRKTGIPLDIIEHGIKKLEEPDKWSRTQNDDGRRIARLDEHRPWGWQIVNYAHYRDIASQEDRRKKARERKRKQRERDAAGAQAAENQTDQDQDPDVTLRNDVTDVTLMSQGGHGVSRVSRHIDIDVDADVDAVKSKVKGPSPFDRFWEVYPKKRKKKTANEIWKRKKLDLKVDLLITDVENRKQHDDRWLSGYTPDPTTYLNQERWDDELTDESGKSLSYTERMALAASKVK